MGRRRVYAKALLLCLLGLIAYPTAAPGQSARQAVAFEFQTVTSSFFTGEVAVDGELEVGLAGLNNDTVAVLTLRSYGAWSTGLTLKGTSTSFGAEIALNGGIALIAEDDALRLVRSFRYNQATGIFQPLGNLERPQLPAATSFGYRMDLSEDGLTAIVSAASYDNPNAIGDDHGAAFVYRRVDTEWVMAQQLDAGTRTQENGRFGYSVAISGDGSRIVIGSNNRVHIFDAPTNDLFQETAVLGHLVTPSGYGWDVDISDDGERILVGAPFYSNSRGAGFVYRRRNGVWTQVNFMSPYAGPNGLGWAVAVSESIAALGTFNLQAPNSRVGRISALFSWGQDLDRPENFDLTGAPHTFALAPYSTSIDVALDGRWMFFGVQSNGGNDLPQITIFEIYTPPPQGPALQNVTPTSVVASTFDMTLDGSNFDAGAIDQVYSRSSGALLGSGTLLSRSSTRLVIRHFAANAPGQYTVRVRNADGRLSAPVDFEVTPPPGLPAPAARATVTGNLVRLNWNMVPGAASYHVSSGTQPGAANLFDGNIGNLLSIAGTAPPGTYYARVRALGPPAPSAPSNELTIYVGCAGPATPPRALASVVTGSRVTFTWTPGTNIDSQLIEGGSAPGLANLAVQPLGVGATFSVAGVPPGTYYVRVRSRNPCGVSAPSNETVLTVR